MNNTNDGKYPTKKVIYNLMLHALYINTFMYIWNNMETDPLL